MVLTALLGNDPTFQDRSLIPMRMVLDKYMAGLLGLYVSLSGEGEAHFKRLTGLNEVWAICARQPENGQVRLFGRFYSNTCFVGTCIFSRDELGDPANYNALASTVLTQWAALFGDQPPHTGNTPEDYLNRECYHVE